MEKLKIHDSETAWVGYKTDFTVSNDGSIDDLYKQIESIINNQVADLPDAT